MTRVLSIAALLIVLGACDSLGTDLQRTLSAGDLVKEYVESKAATRSKYDGKPMRIEGYVLDDARMPGPNEAEGLILLAGEQPGDRTRVSCWFTRREIEKASRVVRGSRLIVEGIFNGERGAELKFCRLVPADPGPVTRER